MSSTIADLMYSLQEDVWRTKVGFSPELMASLDVALNPSTDDNSIAKVFNEWISKYQPCLFGRIAAKNNQINYCLIRESDLDSDANVERKIQVARVEWKRRAQEGDSSGFIIAVLSNRLARSLPDENVLKLASRIGSFYLHEMIEPDRVYLERVRLEQPGEQHRTWEWPAGVNYFSAQGDRRWWQDHRFPAGLAFSVNSVGHMVKSGKLNEAMHYLEQVMGTEEGVFKPPKVDSLPKALGLAMRTISLASSGPSGKATMLMPLDAKIEHPHCPIELPEFLADKDYCEYKGLYHTDVTIPSEYFHGDIERRPGQADTSLDFTYLFDASLDNFDYARMGEGEMVRAFEDEEIVPYKYIKRRRGVGEEVIEP